MGLVRQRPFNSDFQVEVFEKTIAVRFWPIGSLYTFARFTTEREGFAIGSELASSSGAVGTFRNSARNPPCVAYTALKGNAADQDAGALRYSTNR
jgi:hypothetical protein